MSLKWPFVPNNGLLLQLLLSRTEWTTSYGGKLMIILILLLYKMWVWRWPIDLGENTQRCWYIAPLRSVFSWYIWVGQRGGWPLGILSIDHGDRFGWQEAAMRITSRFWIHASVCAPSSHGCRLWHNHSFSNDVYSVSQKTPLNAGVKLGQRLQRWTNFNPALRQLLVLGQPYFSAANSPLDAYD